MGAKHRYIDRREWTRPVERRGRALQGSDGSFAYRTDLLRLREPAYGQLGEQGGWKIADDGWTWLSWMRPDLPWALTAMRDERGEWVQFYFDIVSGIGCDGDGRAWFEDCWLDVVVTADGSAYLLDEDELEEALAGGELTQEMARSAREAAAELMAAFPQGVERLAAFMQRLYAAFDAQHSPEV